MASSTPGFFRFLELPSEIRNTVYRILLCSFEPPPTTVAIGDALENAPASHSIEPAILCTSKQIHREAYDVMVKTNRFIRLSSPGGVPLRFIINTLRLPVVTSDELKVKRFPGYVLAVALSKAVNGNLWVRNFSPEGPCQLMILGWDLDLFCRTLVDAQAYLPDFLPYIKLTITLAPTPFQRTRHKDSIVGFFSERTQEALLAPFRTHLHGYKNVQVRGTVSKTIAKAAQDDMAREAWRDGAEVIRGFSAAKDLGNRYFRERNLAEACLIWGDAALDMEILHKGSSWKGLVERGGHALVTELSKLYFDMKLNIAHVNLIGVQNDFGGISSTFMAKDALSCAQASLKENYWMEGFSWRPSDAQKAKYYYRQALCVRLEGDPATVQTALTYIKLANHRSPGDTVIEREKDAILRWANGL